MSRIWMAVAAMAASTACGGAAQAACRSQSSGILDLSQNSHLLVHVNTDSEGCRISFGLDLSGYSPIHARTVLQQSEIMKKPDRGFLDKVGEFTFFYKPKASFIGKDSFVVYLCGSNLSGKGCTRINYVVTVR